MKQKPYATRIEKDMLGEVKLHAASYYGIHTERAVNNFALDAQRVSEKIIRAYIQVKKACAIANANTGILVSQKAKAIQDACDILIADIDTPPSQRNADANTHINAFLTHPLQGGAGTSLNMNLNEVIANTALTKMGASPGDYDLLHPIDDVNLSQSTNDTFPTAIKISLIYEIRNLADRLASLQATLQKKETEYADALKMGRTQLMDALPITFGQVFGAFAKAISRDRWRIYKAEERLREVNIGGTAIGTGLNTSVDYIYEVTDCLQDITGLGISRADLLVDATQNADVFVEVSGLLKSLASNLIKICNDLRLMNSGPSVGFSEITLEAHQSGSSIMPGKVNPVICEMVNQVGFNVIGGDMTVTLAASSGQFELNPYLPLISHILMTNLTHLCYAVEQLENKCIASLRVNTEKTSEEALNSYAIAAVFIDVLGYEMASEIAKEAYQNNTTIKSVILAHGYLSESEIDSKLNVHALTQPKR